MTLDELLCESLVNLQLELKRYGERLSSRAAEVGIEAQRLDLKKYYEGLKGDVERLGTPLDYVIADTGKRVDPFEIGLAPLPFDDAARARVIEALQRAGEALEWPLSVLGTRSTTTCLSSCRRLSRNARCSTSGGHTGGYL